MDYKAEIKNLLEYKIVKTSEEKRTAKKEKKKLLDNQKKATIEKILDKNDITTDENANHESVSVSNIPVHNSFSYLDNLRYTNEEAYTKEEADIELEFTPSESKSLKMKMLWS